MSELVDSNEELNEPEFLKVKAGDTVLIGEDEIAKVLTFIGGQEILVHPHSFNLQMLIEGKHIGFMLRK